MVRTPSETLGSAGYPESALAEPTQIARGTFDVAEIATTRPVKSWKSPTYPERIHTRERDHWRGILEFWDQRIAEALARPANAGGDPDGPRRHARLLGARDQIAEAVGRLPMEVGALYADDRARLEQAVASLERQLGGSSA